LKIVPEWPLVYWWTRSILGLYESCPLVDDACETRRGASTGSNARFVRSPWEIGVTKLRAVKYMSTHESPDLVGEWVPYVKGAAGRWWIDSLTDVIKWRDCRLELGVSIELAFGEG